jgi:hypothetical protein
MEGTVRPVPGDPLPLGLSRGYRVTRPKQLDFLHRFMASPLVPTFSATRDGLSVNHAHILYITDNWYGNEPDPLLFVPLLLGCCGWEALNVLLAIL